MRTHWCATSHKVGAMYKVQKKGFTLIELLVVIAIIGILASIVYASLSTARGKARDAQRAEAVKTLKAALEVYQNAYGHYPAASTPDNRGTSITTLATTLITENNNNYLVEIPQDSLYKNNALKDYQYVRGSTGMTYGIRVTLENPSGTITLGPNNWCITGVGLNPEWWNADSSPPAPLPPCPF